MCVWKTTNKITHMIKSMTWFQSYRPTLFFVVQRCIVMQYLLFAQNMALLDRKWSAPCWYYLRISLKIKCNSFANTFKQFSWMIIAALDWNLTKACWYGSNWQNDLALNKHLELISKSMTNSVTDQLTACSIQFKAIWSARQHFTKN